MKNFKNTEISELMTYILESYFDVNAFNDNWLNSLKKTLNAPNFPNRNADFQNELANAILHHHISLQQYEKLTGQDFDEEQDLEDWLREVWTMLYEGQAM